MVTQVLRIENQEFQEEIRGFIAVRNSNQLLKQEKKEEKEDKKEDKEEKQCLEKKEEDKQGQNC